MRHFCVPIAAFDVGRKTSVMPGAGSDRFHRFPCTGHVSKPKKE